MKAILRKVFAPILNIFERSEGGYNYKSSYRTILNVVGSLFLFLSLASLAAAVSTSQFGAGLPFVIFLCVGSVCLIVGFLGTDKAVAKIWQNK
jgi:hypothetical protein